MTNRTTVSMKRDFFGTLTPLCGRGGAFGVFVIAALEHRRICRKIYLMWIKKLLTNSTP